MDVSTRNTSKLAHGNETQPDTTWDQHFENASIVVSIDQRSTDHVSGRVLVAEYPTGGGKVLEEAQKRFQDANDGHGPYEKQSFFGVVVGGFPGPTSGNDPHCKPWAEECDSGGARQESGDQRR